MFFLDPVSSLISSTYQALAPDKLVRRSVGYAVVREVASKKLEGHPQGVRALQVQLLPVLLSCNDRQIQWTEGPQMRAALRRFRRAILLRFLALVGRRQ